MKLEDQVVSLKLAKKLKELGFKQDSLYFWAVEMKRGTETNRWSLTSSDHLLQEHPKYSAFTAAEVAEMLPQLINTTKGRSWRNRYLLNIDRPNGWVCHYWDREDPANGDRMLTPVQEDQAIDKNMANALAKQLIYLKKHQLI